MLTYQIRPRTLHLTAEEIPTFPAQVTTIFSFKPDQAFGVESTGGRTVVADKAPAFHWNNNTGRYHADNGGHLSPLQVVSELGDFSLKGGTLSLSERHEHVQSLMQRIDSICFVLPSMLALYFADPPYIERIEGQIGDVPFRWELAELVMAAFPTTQELQEAAFVRAYDDLALVAEPTRRRLLAALGYFHTGCRLLRESKTAGEFIGEAILNFSKVIETLFGSKADDGGCQDCCRMLHAAA